MSTTISLSQIAQFNEKEVRLRGWVRRHRCKGKLQFLTVRDGTGELQAILSKADMDEEQFKAASHLTQESSIEVAGRVRADSRAPGGYELDVLSSLDRDIALDIMTKEMLEAADNHDFEKAAIIRDEIEKFQPK